ncbi:MAG: hypothetical protein NVSMB32_12120 [Actinomycetota bacterium]
MPDPEGNDYDGECQDNTTGLEAGANHPLHHRNPQDVAENQADVLRIAIRVSGEAATGLLA